jgi:hypothetical protein
VKHANEAFYKTFKVEPQNTEGRSLFELGDGQWNISRLKALLNEILPERKMVKDFRVETEFPGLGQRTMMVNAKQFHEDGRGMPFIALAIEDATDGPKKG